MAMTAEPRNEIIQVAERPRLPKPSSRSSPSGRFGSVLVTVSMVLAACSTGPVGDDPSTTITTPATSAPMPDACDDLTSLFQVEAVIDGPAGSCLEWVDRSYGRAVQGSTGSATVWSRRNEHGTALIVGAVHTLGQGWFGPSDTAVTESIVNPGDLTGVARLFLVRPDGSAPDELASPWFGLYNPAIAAERNNNLLQDLLPREDFYVAVADSQKLDVSGLPPIVAPIILEEVPLYDPAGITTINPTWAEAIAGEFVLLLGYPQTTGELTASVGRVLSDNEAEQAISMLADLGDPEGAIPYDSDVEMIIRGEAIAGMSGGGAIDKEGRLVGILVRATYVHEGDQYVRAVRMSWVVARLAATFNELSLSDQEAIRGYLEPMD
jgi:hypothetical protein